MDEPLFVPVPPGPGRLLWEVHTRDGLADMGIAPMPEPGRTVWVPFAERLTGPLMFRGVLQLDDDEDELA